MIRFKDFVPRVVRMGSLFRKEQLEALAAAQEEMNAWLAERDVEVVSVETVALPNIHRPEEEGPEDTSLYTSADTPVYWYQFIRVWYKDST